MKSKILFVILFPLALLSCSNILDEFAKKDTDEARLAAAVKSMNDQDWSSAIRSFENMTPNFLTKREVKLQYAKAYAGRCGVSLLDMVETFSNGISAARLYPILLEMFAGASSSQVEDCIEAESIMLSIAGDATNRTPGENVTLAFISFAKMGGIFSSFADEGTPDGTTDADFNGCSNTTTPGIPEEYVRQVGTGLGIAVTSLTVALTNGAIPGLEAFDAASQACDALATLGSQFDFCSQTDPDAFTADQVKAIRWTLMDNQVIGLGGANACDLGGVTCAVGCPP